MTQSVVAVADGGAIDLATQLTLADVASCSRSPPPATEAEQGYLPASAVGDRGTVLPSAVAPALAGFGNGNGNGGRGPTTTTASYASLRVMALRVDPCFAALESVVGGRCVREPAPARVPGAVGRRELGGRLGGARSQLHRRGLGWAE